MKIEAESWGTPQRDFSDLSKELIAEEKVFDRTTLRLIPYGQLFLCCIGNAGEAACDPSLVVQEKKSRRERFLSMEPEEFVKCELFLRVQGMWEDVLAGIAALGTPRWDDLNYRQKTWAKLNCLFNHVDDPASRIYDAIGLLGRAADHDLPEHVCTHYMGKLKGLVATYPRMGDSSFRNHIEEIRDNIRDFLPEPERSICLRESIRDYQCTSDCFRILL